MAIKKKNLNAFTNIRKYGFIKYFIGPSSFVRFVLGNYRVINVSSQDSFFWMFSKFDTNFVIKNKILRPFDFRTSINIDWTETNWMFNVQPYNVFNTEVTNYFRIKWRNFSLLNPPTYNPIFSRVFLFLAQLALNNRYFINESTSESYIISIFFHVIFEPKLQ